MYISIDLGGTNTRIASTKDLKNIQGSVKVKTQQNIALESDIIRNSILELADGAEIKGICLGVPGFIDKKKRKFEKIVNVPSLTGVYFDEILEDKVEPEKVFVENDADIAGLGEAVLGAGKDFEVIAYLTLSTGVGGVRISSQRIDVNQKFSEPGHMIVVENGKIDPLCGQKGCLSAYLAGTSFERVYGVEPSKCEDSEVWKKYAQKLSLGIINVIAMWSPDVIILGGSLSKKFKPFFEKPLLEKLSEHEFFPIPPIIKNELGDKSGIYGGFVLLDQAGV